MPLYKVKWNIATELALFSGEYIAFADDSDHAIDRVKSDIGKEGGAANFSVEEVGDTVFQTRRNEKLVEAEVYSPLPSSSVGRELFAFEVAARANVIASSEKVAFERFANSIKAGEADGKYCTFFRRAVLEREQIYEMSRAERHALSKGFIRVSGGGVNPR